jgi:hypothetical protein
MLKGDVLFASGSLRRGSYNTALLRVRRRTRFRAALTRCGSTGSPGCARVAAGCLEVGVSEHVGEQGEVAAVVAARTLCEPQGFVRRAP